MDKLQDQGVVDDGRDGAGGFTLNGFRYTGKAAQAMYLTSRKHGIRYKDLCAKLGWSRCRTMVQREAAKAGYVISYFGKKGADRFMRIVPDPKKAKETETKPLGKLEAIAVEHGLQQDAFAAVTAKDKPAARACLWMDPQVFATTKKNLEAANMTIQEVFAEAIGPWCAPPVQIDFKSLMQRSRAHNAAMPRATDMGLGAGIDFDGRYRHVRMADPEGRRAAWRAETAEKVSAAMRDFNAALNTIRKADKTSSHPELSIDDFVALLKRGGRSAKLLAERTPAFRAEVAKLFAVLDKLDAEEVRLGFKG